ncbi:MAG: tetratricopeptide repeat protein [Spirochaetales bacterium]|nr:tetratricopeptide repeat protein [Spirochaetales bacterium]
MNRLRMDPSAGLFLALALLLVGAAAVPAAATDAGGTEASLAEGRELLSRATDAFFDQSLDSPGLRSLLDESRRVFAGILRPAPRLYWQAEVEYLLGFVEQADGRPEEAQRRFEVGRDLILESLDQVESSQAYRLLADTYAQLLILNGLLYKMAYGLKVREMAEEALRLDPRNLKAKLTLALFYKNAPGIAGGSRARSLELLQELEGEPELERVDRFSVYAWLGITYSEGRQPARARRYLERALEVYPGNSWLREMLAELPS